MREKIVCPSCGAEDKFTTEFKHSQQTAFCTECGTFIKNIPYQKPRFYFGKYKDVLVEECTDIGYMEWFLSNTKPKPYMKNAVKKQISKINLASEPSGFCLSHSDSGSTQSFPRDSRYLRLMKCLSIALEDRFELWDWIDRLGDHKGTLEVYWLAEPDDQQMKFFESAWEDCMEVVVHHFVNEVIFKEVYV